MADRAARVFNANEFKHVEIVDDCASGKDRGDPCAERLYCPLQFVGQATRIREHLEGTSGVTACSEVPADVKHENIRVTQEKTREREAKGKKQKVAASAAVVYGQCRIRPHSQPLHWLCGRMPA
jgi:hypothetical protein